MFPIPELRGSVLRRSTPGSGHSFVRLWSCSVVVIACASRSPAIPPSESTPPGSDLRHTIRFYSTRFVRCAEERRTAAARATPHNRMKTQQSACSQRFCTTPSVDATTVQVRFSRRVATLWIFRAPPEASRPTPPDDAPRNPSIATHANLSATTKADATAPSWLRLTCHRIGNGSRAVPRPRGALLALPQLNGRERTRRETRAGHRQLLGERRNINHVMPHARHLPRLRSRRTRGIHLSVCHAHHATAQYRRHTMQSPHNAVTTQRTHTQRKAGPNAETGTETRLSPKGPQTMPRLPRVVIPIGPQTRLGVEKHGLLHLMRIVAVAVLAQTAALRSSGSRGAQVSARAANNAAGHRPHGARASHTTYPRTVTLPAREAHCSAGRLLQWTA